jgi:hypothetical protein
MTEAVQVFEGKGNRNRDVTVHEMVAFLIRKFPEKYSEQDREALTKDGHDWLEHLDAQVKIFGDEHNQPESMLKVWKEAEASGTEINYGF